MIQASSRHTQAARQQGSALLRDVLSRAFLEADPQVSAAAHLKGMTYTFLGCTSTWHPHLWRHPQAQCNQQSTLYKVCMQNHYGLIGRQLDKFHQQMWGVSAGHWPGTARGAADSSAVCSSCTANQYHGRSHTTLQRRDRCVHPKAVAQGKHS